MNTFKFEKIISITKTHFLNHTITQSNNCQFIESEISELAASIFLLYENGMLEHFIPRWISSVYCVKLERKQSFDYSRLYVKSNL